MVKESMDLLELLRKRGMDGDVDFLREALRVMVDGIMEAEVSSRIGARVWRTEPGASDPAQWVPVAIVGHPSRDDRAADPQAQRGELLPQPTGTTASQRASSASSHPTGLCWREIVGMDVGYQ